MFVGIISCPSLLTQAYRLFRLTVDICFLTICQFHLCTTIRAYFVAYGHSCFYTMYLFLFKINSLCYILCYATQVNFVLDFFIHLSVRRVVNMYGPQTKTLQTADAHPGKASGDWLALDERLSNMENHFEINSKSNVQIQHIITVKLLFLVLQQ